MAQPQAEWQTFAGSTTAMEASEASEAKCGEGVRYIRALGARLHLMAEREGLWPLLHAAQTILTEGSPSQEAQHELADAVAWAASATRCMQDEYVWNALACLCAASGRPHQEVFGQPPMTASQQHSQAVWQALSALADRTAGQSYPAVGMIASSPFPLLWFPQWLAEDEIVQLLMQAEESVWNPSPLATEGDAAVRSSESLVLCDSPLVQKLRARAAALLGLAPQHAEPPQLVRYSPGQLYKPHVDWGHGTDASLFIAGQRVATVLAYLTDIPKGCVGGCTHFPHLTREQPQGLRIVPVRGAACAWPNVSMHGMPLIETEHAAEPLIVKPESEQQEHQKVALNLWVRDRPVP